MFLRSVGQVKTERDAGICQTLGARDQGFFPGGCFGHFGTVCGVLEPIFWCNYPLDCFSSPTCAESTFPVYF